MTLISVIIPSFNAKAWIKDAIRSVISQEAGDVEVIVIDDGSTDGTDTAVKAEFPFARLVRTENRGPSSARNLGTGLSKGKFIQYLDADDLLAPGKLKIQLNALEESGADAAYGNWQKMVEQPDGGYVKRKVIKRKMKNPQIDLFTDFWCPPAAYLFRRSIVEKIGGWNENLPIIQDARFALDCAVHGGEFIYCDEVMAYYRVHSALSVSRKNPVAFNRDCLRNAVEIEKLWEDKGGINKERRRALLRVFGSVARGSFENDKQTFETAYRTLQKWNPCYIPEKPKLLALLSMIFGYLRAEEIALRYRHVKAILFSTRKKM